MYEGASYSIDPYIFQSWSMLNTSPSDQRSAARLQGELLSNPAQTIARGGGYAKAMEIPVRVVDIGGSYEYRCDTSAR